MVEAGLVFSALGFLYCFIRQYREFQDKVVPWIIGWVACAVLFWLLGGFTWLQQFWSVHQSMLVQYAKLSLIAFVLVSACGSVLFVAIALTPHIFNSKQRNQWLNWAAIALIAMIVFGVLLALFYYMDQAHGV